MINIKMANDDPKKDEQNQVQANENTIDTVAEAESAESAAKVLESVSKAKSEEEKPEQEKEKLAEEKVSKAVSKDLESIIEKIEKLSVLELADLVHALEERFGVSAQAPVAVATPTSATSVETSDEEQTQFNVILTNSGANKIGVIKAVRELVPTLGLKEAKDLVEAAPKTILEAVNKETANEAKTKLTVVGATVELE